MTDFNTMTLDEAIKTESELRAFIKEQRAVARAAAKAEKETATNEAIEAGKQFASDLEIGGKVSVYFKGSIEDAIVREKLSDNSKTLKVTLENVKKDDGKPYNTAIRFDKIVIS